MAIKYGNIEKEIFKNIYELSGIFLPKDLYHLLQRIFSLLFTKIRYNTIWKTLSFYMMLEKENSLMRFCFAK